MADVQQNSQDPELQALREKWAPEWKIWRARHRDDKPGERPTGEFLATRPRDDESGADRTIMQPTAEQLDAALRQQQRAGRGAVGTRLSLPIMWAQE